MDPKPLIDWGAVVTALVTSLLVSLLITFPGALIVAWYAARRSARTERQKAERLERCGSCQRRVPASFVRMTVWSAAGSLAHPEPEPICLVCRGEERDYP